jgi:SHS2 domain-containing protein
MGLLPVRSDANRRRRFIVVEHGADLGLIAYGSTEEELYRHAAAGLFSLIVKAGRVVPSIERTIIVEGGEERLIVFLNELLFLWDTERFVPGELSVEIHGSRVWAWLQGEPFHEGRHRVRKEIKAVTYHGYEIRQWRGRLRARLVLDI